MDYETKKKLENEKQEFYFAAIIFIGSMFVMGLFVQISDEFKETGKLMMQLAVILFLLGFLCKALYHAWKICKLDDGKP